MNTFDFIVIAVGLAMDASAVSLAAAASGYAKDGRAVFRLSFHFGLFQFFMPVLGWYSGILFVQYMKSVDHWIAFLLLAFVGLRMIMSGANPKAEEHKTDPSKGISLIMLSLATSIDALAIGLSLAMLEVNIFYPGIIIGLVTATLSLVAIRLGKRLGTLFGNRMEILGGVILISIGFRILWTHLSG